MAYTKLYKTYYHHYYLITVLKKFFFKNGKLKIQLHWVDFFMLIVKFKLLFKYAYQYHSNKILVTLIPENQQWRFKILFFKKYFKLIKNTNIYNLNLVDIFNYLTILNKNILKELIK